MKNFMAVLIFLTLPWFVHAAERGLTCDEIADPVPAFSHMERATTYFSNQVSRSDPVQLGEREDWELIDDAGFDLFVHPGKYLGYAYNQALTALEAVTDQEGIIPLAQEAVSYAPQWLKADLEYTFSQLNTTNQEVWADLLLQAEHPYVDEIAYSIAHSSAAYLSSEFYHPQLFFENASLIYEIDQDLEYVQVVDYGTPGTDPDYYSTTSYLKEDEQGQTVEIEVPKDIYYMYLVHPKNTDEIPAYIDPDIIESNINHQNNITDPPDGVFWRDFLYNHNDEGYPLLKDYLMACNIVWDSQSLQPTNAIGAISTWLAETLTFTSDAERPHQPVRIYRKHIGRCGEHADMRSAAARTALIPCTSILTISTDHTWNEFWDERWVHWDSPEIDNPLVYENGWGKVHASVFEIKSNGLLTPVSAKYSEGYANLVIYVLDPDENPVDGARIVLGMLDGADIRSDNVGFTDNEGKYDFEVGEGRTYYARMTSDLGNIEDYQLLIENVGDGETHTFSFSVPEYMPVIEFSEVNTPDDDQDDFLLAVDFQVESQVITGAIVFDDIDDSEFFDGCQGGNLNYFMFDLLNFSSYAAGFLFETFNTGFESSGAEVDFYMPEPDFGYWYALFDNSLRINNPQHLSGSISLYEFQETSGGNDDLPAGLVLNNYPNPFNPLTEISFQLPKAGKVQLSIYNIRGQLVEKLLDDYKPAGLHKQSWDASASRSGIYFCEILTGDRKIRKKMCLIK